MGVCSARTTVVSRSRTLQSAPRRSLAKAVGPIIESLEGRRLFAITTIQPLPFSLDFSADRGELVDKDGEGTGFTRVQTNKNGNLSSYNASLIDLDTVTGVLKITTSGNSTAGSNYNGDNTLVNGLETQFNATTSGFAITTRLRGPLSFIDNPSEQAGIMFGPDQDNYVKLVAVAQPSGQFIQFIDEQTSGTTYSHALAGSNINNTYTNVGSFASINTLDLRLVGDADTGKVTAFYSVNGAAFVKISAELTLTGSKKDAFFSSAGRAGLIAAHKNDLGAMTVTFDSFQITAGSPVGAQPSIVASDPANGQTNVARDTAIRNSVYLPTPGAGVDADSLDANTVKLYRTSDGAVVAGNMGTSGGGDVINFSPNVLLDANTNYTFVIDGVKDTSGALFYRYEISFTTGTVTTPVNTSFAFEKITLNPASGQSYTAVKMGPDGKLYAATLEGLIQRFNINADGTLGAAENITSLQTAEGGNRFLTGIAFDPASTASNLILWVSHSHYALTNAQDWSGKISKLTGPNLATVAAVVKNLPRSIRDHTTNQLAFGPDGKLYFTQGSQSAMGAPDNAWGLRAEHLLSAAVLRLNPSLIPAGTTLDVKTEDGGTYNPFATNAPLTIYGRGVRNAYDLLFHSNGRLYVPTNGSSSGGNTPAGGGAPALNDVREVMNDYLFDVVEGGYYGHPNPHLGHYVLNGGNPTAGVDPGEVLSYPVGTMPDANYEGFAYDFGKNQSPNGVIEYRSGGSAFGGTLDGKILVVQYSVGNDVVALTPGAGGVITGVNVNIPGLTSFNDPLDLEVNPANGFIYVVEHGGQKITLARPITPGANAEVDKQKLVFNDPTTSGSQTQQLTVKNTGTGPLVLDTDAFTLTGADASKWALTKPALPLTLQPGESVQLGVKFTATNTRIYNATLVVKTSDPDTPTMNVVLRGLGTSGVGGSHEPSLQRILDLYQIPINVGDADPLTTALQTPLTTPNDELVMPRLHRAGSSPVTIEPLAVFGVGHSTLPTLRFGYYTPGNRVDRTELFTVRGTANAQTVVPNITGELSFDPGSAMFSLYGLWPSMSTISSSFPQGTQTYSEDVLNYELDPSSLRKFRFYQLKGADGTVVPNAYVVAVEEFTGGNYDNQDVVFIIRNVKPAAPGAEIGYENLDAAPYNDRMIFNRISNPDSVNPNYVKDLGKIRLRNTGSSDLTINGLTLSNTAAWELVSAPTGAFTLAANGGYEDILIRFKATSGSIHNGTLTIASSDADEPTTVIQLAGWRQNRSENNEEPTLPEHLQLLGYTTQITKPGQTLNNGGTVEAIGDEVLSPYWKRADAGEPVAVRQLSAYHTQGNTATVRYHTKGSTSTTTLFTHAGSDGQTFFPRIDGSLAPAIGSFSHTGTFGFRIDNEWSDPARNTSADDGGHHVRFFVVKDRNGKVVPNTYLMVMDYAGINYDYQDNIYLVTNVKPEFGPAAPSGLTSASASNGIALDWNDNNEPNLRGYAVYRSDAAGGTYTKLNGSVLTQSAYLDTTAPLGAMSYYRVVAVDLNGTESVAATASAAYNSSDTTPPAAPSGLTLTPSTGGILLDWADNAESDLAGYQVWHATSASGPFTKLNDALLTTSTFNDTAAPIGLVSYYAIYAIDSSGNVSPVTNGQATRPVADTQPPAAPAGEAATVQPNGVALNWVDNIEPDLAGYNVYRATSATGPFTKLNGSLLTISEFLDTAAPTGTSYYRITAVDVSGNESAPATLTATRTASYTGTNVNGSTPAGSHQPIVEGSDYDVTGGGTNITGTNDKFYFLYQQLTGDFDVKVRVDGITNSDPSAKAGLMARESLTGDSRNVFMFGTVDERNRMSHRSDTGGNTLISTAQAATYPNNWLRLKREGNTFTGYFSTDGVNWTQASSVTVSLPDTLFFGMAVSSKSSTKTATAQFRQLSNAGETNPTPTPTAPAAPTGLTADGSTNGVQLDWANNTEADLAGYYVYRSSTQDGTYTRISGSSPIASSDFLDTSAPAGETSFYRVAAVSTASLESSFATASALRPAATDTTAPATPAGASATGSTSGVFVDWTDNGEGDLAGYNLYRSDSLNGTYTLVNTGGLLTDSAYADASMPAGATMYYKLTAVDTTDNESAMSSAVSATRAQSSSPSSITLGAVADATVRGGSNGDTNYGNTGTLEVKDADASRDRHAYLKFDLTGVTSVTNGVVRLFGYLADADRAVDVSLHAVSDNGWTESGITYNNAPALGNALATQTITGYLPSRAAWYEFDVTAYLQAALAAGKTEVTLAIVTQNSVRVAFNSAEAASDQPALVITT